MGRQADSVPNASNIVVPCNCGFYPVVMLILNVKSGVVSLLNYLRVN